MIYLGKLDLRRMNKIAINLSVLIFLVILYYLLFKGNKQTNTTGGSKNVPRANCNPYKEEED